MSVSQTAEEETTVSNPSPITAEADDAEEDLEERSESKGTPPVFAAQDQNGDGDMHIQPTSGGSSPATAKPTAEDVQADNEQNQGSKNAGEGEAIPVSDDEETMTEFVQQFHSQDAQPQYEGDLIATPVEELDEINIAREISNYMHVNRVNLAELDTLEEMWGLCDAISAAHSGLPDSLLKEAFHLVLEGYYGHSKNSWMRNHLDHLSRMWKKEMLKEKSTTRPTKFISSTVNYSPPHGNTDTKTKSECQNMDSAKQEQVKEQTNEKESGIKQVNDEVTTHTASADGDSLAKQRRQRKQAAKRKRALAVIMGVGQMLEHARRKFATEDGELDVDEDEYGNFSIGGMELSFETWGQLNKIKQDGIVHADVEPASKRRKSSTQNGKSNLLAAQVIAKQIGNNAPMPPNFSIGTPPSKPSMAEQYPTVREVEMPNEEMKLGNETTKIGVKKLRTKSDKQEKREEKMRKEEKDEGEISSSESDKPTSSSEDESSSDEKKVRTKKTMAPVIPIRTAHERRKARREDEREQGAASAQNLQVLLRKCFELRYRIVRKLSVQQKAMFMDMMKQSMAGSLQQHVQQQQQHQALAQLMRSFAHQS